MVDLARQMGDEKDSYAEDTLIAKEFGTDCQLKNSKGCNRESHEVKHKRIVSQNQRIQGPQERVKKGQKKKKG